MKKTWMTLFFLASVSASAETGVYCQMKDFTACKDCGSRIPVSCEDHKFNGSVELKTKPQKIHWLISNSSNGSDRVVVTDNFGLDIQGLKSQQKNFAVFLKKKNVILTNGEKVFLNGITLGTETALYKAQQGTTIAAKLTANPKRNIASDALSYQIGGIQRAQKMQAKETK